MRRDPRRYFKVESCGHLFEFDQLNSGSIRALAVDGRYNDRANAVLSRLASQAAIDQAWDAARLHYWRLANGVAAREPLRSWAMGKLFGYSEDAIADYLEGL